MAQGTGVPGLGMVFEGKRGDPSPCTGTGMALFTAPHLQMLEVLQESQDLLSDPLCSLGTGWQSRGP